MNILLIGTAQPKDPRHHWLKQKSSADVAHYVIWKNENELRSGCRIKMDAATAVQARNGARLCEVCLTDLRERLKRARDKRRK